MIQVKSRNTKNSVKITIKGDASIKNGENIYEKISQSLQENKNIELDVKDVSEADISFLQILGSIYKTQYKKGKELTITDDLLSDPVKEAMERSGLFASPHSTIVPEKPSPFYEMIKKTGG